MKVLMISLLAVLTSSPGVRSFSSLRTITSTTTTRLYSSSSTTTTTTTAAAETANNNNNNLVNGRISRGDISSLDARTVEQNLELVLSHLKSRRANDETLNKAQQIADLNSSRVDLIMQRDKYLSVRKEQSAIVGKFMRENKKEEAEEAKALSSKAGEDADIINTQLAEIQMKVDDLLSNLPNVLDDRVPDGDDDTMNEVVSTWGNPQDLPRELQWTEDFEPLWHDDIAANLSGWMGENAVKISGARFAALSGNVAKLERSLSQFFLDTHCSNGYTEVSVPYIVGRSALEGTSQLPKFEDDLFSIRQESHTCNGEDAFLIPTAEVPLTNLHRDSILEEDNLPISYVALTPCFRAEAGSSGRDTKGLFRMHQFQKVELVKITSTETSDEEHEKLTMHAQACLEALKLPYRKVRLCSGDIGFSARHCYDLEVWLPGQGAYREISSCSNTGDFQARRMALRYRPSVKPTDETNNHDAKGGKKKAVKKPKPQLCHTINGSGVAVGRALIAVLENYQLPNGDVVVPEVLRPYMGGVDVLKAKN